MKRMLNFKLLGSVVGVALCCSCTRTPMSVIPEPQTMVVQKGRFVPNHHTLLYMETPAEAQPMLAERIMSFAEGLQQTKQKPLENAICLMLVDRLTGISSAEGYQLSVSSKRIKVEATTVAGLLYGVQTLVQMKGDRSYLKAVEVTDYPRFAYRGLMLDVSRHFVDKKFVMKQLDAMAQFKLNRLHLHLTDAAGWRIEIQKYPRLTQLGAWRTSKEWKPWWNSARHYAEEGSDSAFGGYYSQQDIREMVAYAQKRNIVIVPEIEMPAHSEEVLTAYPELSCTHELYKQADFCVGNEQTFRFIEEVLKEVMDLFPSEYIHVGGDEAGKASWHNCKLCQARMKTEGLHQVDELQSYMIHRVERFLNAHGRKLLGWDEIMDGGLAPGATVMSWRGEEGGVAAVKAGHRAIMSPGEFCYLDAYQDAPALQPEAIGGYLPLRKVYAYNPVPSQLTPMEAPLIYGVQGNLWTEYVPTPERVEQMLYPRALAIAEVGWTNLKRKNWKRFRAATIDALSVLQTKGYHVFDFRKEYGNRKEEGQFLRHKALGKKVVYNAPYNLTYKAGGDSSLVDGRRGGWSYNDKRWQGFISKNRLDVTIDMGAPTKLHAVEANFMQVCGPEVFFPAEVIVSVSLDNVHFMELSRRSYPVIKEDGVAFETRGWKGRSTARYIRYQARAGAFGGFLFTDEIMVK
ncbi:MAG: family 20 glycosylhydrolase [Bacteroidaceae bacterium]